MSTLFRSLRVARWRGTAKNALAFVLFFGMFFGWWFLFWRAS